MAGRIEAPIASVAAVRRGRPCRGAAAASALALAAVLAASLSALAAAITTLPSVAAAATTGAPSSTAPTSAPTTTSTTKPATGSASEPASPADAWLLKAITAEERFGSVRIQGKVTQGKSVLVLDLLVNGDGEGGGVIVQDGSVIKLERVGTLLYFNAPKKYWSARATAAQADAYGGKWIELPAADTRFLSFDEFLDAAVLVAATFQGDTSTLTLGKTTKFAGRKVVVLKDAVSVKGTRSTGLMDIGTGSPHYVYKIVESTPGDSSTLVFDHYGKAVTLTVPPEPIPVS